MLPRRVSNACSCARERDMPIKKRFAAKFERWLNRLQSNSHLKSSEIVFSSLSIPPAPVQPAAHWAHFFLGLPVCLDIDSKSLNCIGNIRQNMPFYYSSQEMLSWRQSNYQFSKNNNKKTNKISKFLSSKIDIFVFVSVRVYHFEN